MAPTVDTDKLYYRHQLQPTAVQHCLVEAAGYFDAFLDPHSRATLQEILIVEWPLLMTGSPKIKRGWGYGGALIRYPM